MKMFKNLSLRNMSIMLLLVAASTPVIGQNVTALSDAEVASVAVTANQIDINYAGIAKKKSTNAEILKFAETMVNDHKAVIAQAAALIQKLGVTLKDNSVSQKMVSDAEKTKKLLNSKKGKEFDKAYIDNEVAYHKAVISAVETVLIPETENQELKDLLKNILPALKTHLDHATMVQTQLSK